MYNSGKWQLQQETASIQCVCKMRHSQTSLSELIRTKANYVKMPHGTPAIPD